MWGFDNCNITWGSVKSVGALLQISSLFAVRISVSGFWTACSNSGLFWVHFCPVPCPIYLSLTLPFYAAINKLLLLCYFIQKQFTCTWSLFDEHGFCIAVYKRQEIILVPIQRGLRLWFSFVTNKKPILLWKVFYRYIKYEQDDRFVSGKNFTSQNGIIDPSVREALHFLIGFTSLLRNGWCWSSHHQPSAASLQVKWGS